MKPKCNSVIMSNMWFGLMEFSKAGDVVEGHKHLFDHCTLLSHGRFNVVRYDTKGTIELDEELDSPCIIFIDKNHVHSITALTDNAVACCCHAVYESEQSLFPIEDAPIVNGSLKIPLIKNDDL